MQWSFYILRLISTSTWFQTDMGIKCAKFHFIPMSSDLPPAVMFSPSVDPTNRIRITEKTISHHFIHIDLRMCCCWILPGSIVHQSYEMQFLSSFILAFQITPYLSSFTRPLFLQTVQHVFPNELGLELYFAPRVCSGAPFMGLARLKILYDSIRRGSTWRLGSNDG